MTSDSVYVLGEMLYQGLDIVDSLCQHRDTGDTRSNTIEQPAHDRPPWGGLQHLGTRSFGQVMYVGKVYNGIFV